MVEIAIFLGIAGAAFGSFIDAFTWRLHTKRNFVSDRSECEHCHHKLGPWDLIPIFSWILLGGKCRYCGKPITPLAPLTELALGLIFVASYLYWPLGFASWQAITLFVLWLLYMVLLGILFVYDLRWLLLPDVIVLPLIALGFADAAIQTSLRGGTIVDLSSQIVLGVAAMAGLYWVLYVVSKGKWVGFGDIKLAVFMGAVLGWEKTLLLLMLANFIGLLVVLPGLLTKKLSATSRVPFGPFMIVAFVLVGLVGDRLIEWYIRTFIGF